jgi:D-alanyl-D-alanine carboxypeptidase
LPAPETGEPSFQTHTKTFVAAEVLLLAKSGRIDLDAPLSTYVKHRLTSNGATVRQHLAMRSGLPNYLPADYTRMDEAIAAAPARQWTSEQILAYDTAPSGNSEYNYSNPSSRAPGGHARLHQPDGRRT